MDILTNYGLDLIFYYRAPDSPLSLGGRIVPDGLEFIELLLEGEVLFEHRGAMRRFGRGTIFWHRPHQYTIHYPVRGNPYTCLCFQLGALPERLVPRVSHWREPATLDLFVGRVIRERLAAETPNDRAILEHLFRSELLNQARKKHVRMDDHDITELPAALRRAMDLLETPSDRIRPLKEVAQVAGISESYLFALFRKHLSTNPHHYEREQRIRHASVLLRSSNLTIKEIAGMCGFADLKNFYRTFRQYYAVTPGDWKQRSLADKISASNSERLSDLVRFTGHHRFSDNQE